MDMKSRAKLLELEFQVIDKAKSVRLLKLWQATLLLVCLTDIVGISAPTAFAKPMTDIAGLAVSTRAADLVLPVTTTTKAEQRSPQLESAAASVTIKTVPKPTPQSTSVPTANAVPTTATALPTASFIIPPHVVPKHQINPFTTTIPLNGSAINHLTNQRTATSYELGGGRSDNFTFNGLIRLNSQVVQSLSSDNILTIEQTGSYAQFQTLRKSREITIKRDAPQTLTSLGLQLSLTAACTLPGASPDDQCTYTPGLVTDRNSIAPDFLVPTRILQPSTVGEVLSPESLAVIRQPGFQAGANGQAIGLDLYFPNAGAAPGNSQSHVTALARNENIASTPTTTYAQVKQIVRANDREAVIGRTVRGWTWIAGDQQALMDVAFELGAELLPDLVPQLQGSTNQVNTNVNKNLFLAAGNTRLPGNSLTIYQAGIGRAPTPKTPPKSLNQLPAATFNDLWIGLSPVTKISFSSRARFELTGPQRVVVEAGAEGGAGQDLSFMSAVNGQAFSTAELNNFYTQIYLSTTHQDVNLQTTTKLKEETNYYPHISWSGNVTNSQQVFRYYAGLIWGPKINPYLGLDLTRSTPSGWTYTAGAIGYLNPDQDYYSQVFGSVSKRIGLSRNSNLILSTGFKYVLDQAALLRRDVAITPASAVTLAASANFGPVSLGLVNYFGALLPNSVGNTLLANLEVKLNRQLKLSAYFTPINQNSSGSRFSATAQWQLSKSPNSPIFVAGWSNNEYNFGMDSFGQELRTTNNAFTLLLKMGS